MNEQIQKLEEALLKRAIGYEYEETEIIASKDGKTTKIKKVKKHMPPDINAIKMLINRQKMNKIKNKSNK